LMSEDALGTRISVEFSPTHVALSRVMLGSVGVKIGVKGRSQIGGFQYTGQENSVRPDKGPK
jgi:hypothetical protein